MVLAALVGGMFLIALVLTDWWHFMSLTPRSSRYGFKIVRVEERLPFGPLECVMHRFDNNGVLSLPHGIAHLFKEKRIILLRPQARLFSLSVRTVWPMKGTIELEAEGGILRLIYVKRIPWSSALLTLLWFAVVGAGTVGFVIAYVSNGGFGSLSGLIMGLGITGVGLLVLIFGIIIVSLGYSLENHRLTETYQELRAILPFPAY
jgi:hypothetical protein